MEQRQLTCVIFNFLLLIVSTVPQFATAKDANNDNLWTQWRGPNRDGIVAGKQWPDRLSEANVEPLWRKPLGPSYSGPIASEDMVYTTETMDRKKEIVRAYDRKSGEERWKAEWEGSLTVPFFAASNGSWIRATPAYDGESLYVAGMRDVLVCFDAKTGDERWRVDFVKDFKTPLPAFGFVCSPLVDGDAVYVQAGAAVLKLNKQSGKVVWRALEDAGGMNGSAFSSPTIGTLGGVRQLLVQTREKLAGIDLDSGDVLWTEVVPSFRGMNILTPTVYGESVFTSSYQNKSWLYGVAKNEDQFSVAETWSNNAQGYMSTPIVINGHAYMHLQNERFTCIDLRTGERTWTSKPQGKYCSLVAQGDRILALRNDGKLLYIQANPEEFKLIDEFQVSDSETWAYLAVAGDEFYVRELDGLSAFRWKQSEGK